MAGEHYTFIDPVTGEVFQRKPEYSTMSRRPGIGAGFFNKFYTDMYPRDFVIFKGRKLKPPKFYDRMYEVLTASEEQFVNLHMSNLKRSRVLKAKLYVDDNTPDRLAVKERVTLARLTQLTRGVDHVT